MPSALANHHTMTTHVCAQCFGPLVEKWIDDQFTVVCPKGCQPGGFVTKAYADRRKAASLEELYDVYHNLPALKPATTVNARALFQEEL